MHWTGASRDDKGEVDEAVSELSRAVDLVMCLSIVQFLCHLLVLLGKNSLYRPQEDRILEQMRSNSFKLAPAFFFFGYYGLA